MHGRAARRNTIGITIEITSGRREENRPGGRDGQGNKGRKQHGITEGEEERREKEEGSEVEELEIGLSCIVMVVLYRKVADWSP